VKVKTLNIFVFLLFVLWALNPIGGQVSLRVLSEGVQQISTPSRFYYVSTNAPTYPGALLEFATATAGVFNAFLFSPASSKQGTQDIYGNLKVPMLEALKASASPAADGWYYTQTIGSDTGIDVAAYFGLPNRTNQTLANTSSSTVYTAVVGIPFLRKLRVDKAKSQQSNTPFLGEEEGIINGQDVTTMASTFGFETEYFYLNWSVKQAELNNTAYTLTSNSSTPTNFWK
jgi:hypothetical protein